MHDVFGRVVDLSGLCNHIEPIDLREHKLADVLGWIR
jgi:hypothetical protein